MDNEKKEQPELTKKEVWIIIKFYLAVIIMFICGKFVSSENVYVFAIAWTGVLSSAVLILYWLPKYLLFPINERSARLKKPNGNSN